MELSWPEGGSGPAIMNGRARDLITLDSPAETRVVNDDRLQVRIGHDKIIEELSLQPPLPGVEVLKGCHATVGFRRALVPIVTQEAAFRRPATVLLDDIVGSSVISPWIAVKWDPPRDSHEVDRTSQENVCSGYATGSVALFDRSQVDVPRLVPRLQPDDDALAFHDLGPDRDRLLRRVRRIDLWREGNGIVGIDAMFQDSGVIMGTRRAALHEYRLIARAAVSDNGLILTEITAVPGVLPYSECLGAKSSLQRLVGTPLAEFRRTVLSQLRGPVGCTHLNDAARSLAEAEALVAHLPAFSNQPEGQL
ncbi:DUF2889 domain-containing protein [Sphingobium sp. V4]|uniref:DUF2889 domain-containing protein n=1 Tax=Sphingobium sp. V4 TaxID=3038927 RepID=UPI002557CF87|nr:DUF2889 domain-containing protein [Sphingobium sp. V4]WIW89426.1 DUF2889 domain-containing protein [Sphingobium sp. V4]